MEDIAALRQKLQDDVEVSYDDLGAGFKKIRMAISSKKAGKRGGARVITLDIIFQEPDTDGDLKEIILFSIYDKSEMASITTSDLKELAKNLGYA